MDGFDDFRPLVAGTVSWPEGAVEVDLGREVVRVEADDLAAVRQVLGDCNGSTPVRALVERHGEDARALIDLLAERGAVVDGEHAWRIAHRHGSVGTALGRGSSEDELQLMLRSRHRPSIPPSAPVALAPTAGALSALLAARRSTWPGEVAAPVTFTGLSCVLAAAYGYRAAPGEPVRDGTVPSAGGLYPLLLHVLVPARLGPLTPGLWWHDPAALALHRLGAPPADPAALFVAGEPARSLGDNGAPTVFISADLERPARKYGARAYRFALLEAGAAMQAASLAAVEAGVPLRALGGIDDDAVRALLRLPEHAVALLGLSLGA